MIERRERLRRFAAASFALTLSACFANQERPTRFDPSYLYPDAEIVPPDSGILPLDAELDGGVRPDVETRDLGVRDLGPRMDADPIDTGPDDLGPPGDTGPRDPVQGLPAPIQIGGRFRLTEGPNWRDPTLPAPNNVLVFTDLGQNTIHLATPPNWNVTVLRMPSDFTNGLGNAADGTLLACEHQTRRVTRRLGDGTINVVADRWQGMAFNSPNDLVVRSDGTIYFTDPPYGLEGRTREIPFNGLFRIEPGGTVHDEWRGAVDTGTITQDLPNGIDLSRDEQTLYMADSAHQRVLAFDVMGDGSLSAPRLFVQTTGLDPDGIAIDEDDNVYVASGTGIEVYTPGGRLWGTIPIPGNRPNNIAFGGADRRTAFIAAGPFDGAHMYRIQMNIPGAR
jgi:gluconolactonase